MPASFLIRDNSFWLNYFWIEHLRKFTNNWSPLLQKLLFETDRVNTSLKTDWVSGVVGRGGGRLVIARLLSTSTKDKRTSHNVYINETPCDQYSLYVTASSHWAGEKKHSASLWYWSNVQITQGKQITFLSTHRRVFWTPFYETRGRKRGPSVSLNCLQDVWRPRDCEGWKGEVQQTREVNRTKDQ